MTAATCLRFFAPAAAVVALIAAGCGADSNGAVPEASRTVGASTTAAPSTDQRLQALLDEAVELDPDVTGVLLHVDAPGISWSGAAGVADRATGAPLEPGAPFRIASNTKTFTAAAVYRLQEVGELDVDDRIAAHLPARLVAQLPGGDRITVRQLLEHTSGLYDYATDPAYVEVVLSRPAHRWTPLEQVRFALEHGKPYGAPGETFHYSARATCSPGRSSSRSPVSPWPRRYEACSASVGSVSTPRGSSRSSRYRPALCPVLISTSATWTPTTSTRASTCSAAAGWSRPRLTLPASGAPCSPGRCTSSPGRSPRC